MHIHARRCSLLPFRGRLSNTVERFGSSFSSGHRKMYFARQQVLWFCLLCGLGSFSNQTVENCVARAQRGCCMLSSECAKFWPQKYREIVEFDIIFRQLCYKYKPWCRVCLWEFLRCVPQLANGEQPTVLFKPPAAVYGNSKPGLLRKVPKQIKKCNKKQKAKAG